MMLGNKIQIPLLALLVIGTLLVLAKVMLEKMETAPPEPAAMLFPKTSAMLDSELDK